MKLGKAHLIASFVAMALSIAYVIYSFSGAPTSAVARPVEAMSANEQPAAVPTASGGAARPIDPTTVPAPPDVALDRLPQWPRNPFAPVAPIVTDEPQPIVPVVDTAAPPAQPDVVVATIMKTSKGPLAMVNGRTVSIGDRVGEETVVDILADAVVLESPAFGRRTVPKRTRTLGAGAAPRREAGRP